MIGLFFSFPVVSPVHIPSIPPLLLVKSPFVSVFSHIFPWFSHVFQHFSPQFSQHFSIFQHLSHIFQHFPMVSHGFPTASASMDGKPRLDQDLGAQRDLVTKTKHERDEHRLEGGRALFGAWKKRGKI